MASVVVGLGLLERIEDGDRETVRCAFADRAKTLLKPSSKNLSAVLAAVPEWIGDEFVGLRREHGAQQVRIDVCE